MSQLKTLYSDIKFKQIYSEHKTLSFKARLVADYTPPTHHPLFLYFITHTRKKRFFIKYSLRNLCKGKFYWQSSCSAFSVSKREVDKVCKYILNQAIHHRKQTFVEEHKQLLKFYQQTLSCK